MTKEEIKKLAIAAVEKRPTNINILSVMELMFIEGFKTCHDMNRWISVEEFPVTKDGEFTVYDPNDNGPWKIKTAMFSEWTKNWVENSGDIIHPTYYRPLPEPPTKTNN